MLGWTKQVEAYKYLFYHQGGSERTGKKVSLYDSAGVEHIVWFVDGRQLKTKRPYIMKTGGVLCYLRHEVFPWLIDMLRNEKPIYIHWSVPTKYTLAKATISTIEEPPGEEETP